MRSTPSSITARRAEDVKRRPYTLARTWPRDSSGGGWRRQLAQRVRLEGRRMAQLWQRGTGAACLCRHAAQRRWPDQPRQIAHCAVRDRVGALLCLAHRMRGRRRRPRGRSRMNSRIICWRPRHRRRRAQTMSANFSPISPPSISAPGLPSTARSPSASPTTPARRSSRRPSARSASRPGRSRSPARHG